MQSLYPPPLIASNIPNWINCLEVVQDKPKHIYKNIFNDAQSTQLKRIRHEHGHILTHLDQIKQKEFKQQTKIFTKTTSLCSKSPTHPLEWTCKVCAIVGIDWNPYPIHLSAKEELALGSRMR